MKLTAILIAALLCTGCALFPPEPQAVVETAKGTGCEIKGINTSDSFNWRFLGFATTRNTNVACHKPGVE